MAKAPPATAGKTESAGGPTGCRSYPPAEAVTTQATKPRTTDPFPTHPFTTMKLSAKSSGNFTPCPEFTGCGVCVDVTPPETKQTDYGPKEKFRIVFEIDLMDEAAKPPRPHCVWSSGFTTSLNEKASLRKFLRTWFGRDPDRSGARGVRHRDP